MDIGKIKMNIMIDKFMRNGMDVSPYEFRTTEDKYNFFSMFETYLLSLDNGERGFFVEFDDMMDLLIFNRDSEQIGKFGLSEDLSSLNFFLIEQRELNNEYLKDIKYIISVFFLAIKEYNNEIGLSTEEEPIPKTARKYKEVGEFDNIVNKIREIQKSIFDKKYKYTRGGK